jgi:hypothetical protein
MSPPETLSKQGLESLGILHAGCAHDFSNMQCGIIGIADLMLDDPDLDSSVAENLREIRNIALRSSAMMLELMIHAENTRSSTRRKPPKSERAKGPSSLAATAR